MNWKNIYDKSSALYYTLVGACYISDMLPEENRPFIYFDGNEASIYEYVSKLLGKWTIDKRTSGGNKGSTGSYSENYDVIGDFSSLSAKMRIIKERMKVFIFYLILDFAFLSL